MGENVLVEKEDGQFVQGRVVKDGDPITVEYGGRKTKIRVSDDRVYGLGSRAAAVTINDFAACKTAPDTWVGCLIKQVASGRVEVEDAQGKTYDLAEGDVVGLREETRRRIGQKHKELSEHRDFFAAMNQQTRPYQPPGWEPKPGDEVVARHEDGSWRGGRIRRITPTNVHVSWDDKSPLSIREAREVTPKPKKPQDVQPGQMVLARPRKGSVWELYRVQSIDAKGVLIVDQDGRSRKARKSELIEFGS